MKKILLITLLLFSTNIFAQPKTIYVVDNENNVLLSKNDEAVLPIASITKLMTAVIVLEQQLPLDEVIQITYDDVYGTYLKNKPTYSRMAVGNTYTREQLLQLALMSSQNRAAYALGRTSRGGIKNFVYLMNKKAIELNMDHTSFVEPTGLDHKNVSTAKDLAILLNYIKENHPLIAEFSTKPSLVLSKNSTFNTTNGLVRSKNWNISIQKTGFINQAGRCVAMMANIADKQITIIILGAVDSADRILTANNIKHFIEFGTFPQPSKSRKRKNR